MNGHWKRIRLETRGCSRSSRITYSLFVPDGYVAVDHVELDIKEMLELGKRAASIHKSNSNPVEAEVISTGSRCVCVCARSFSLFIH